jgi:hypothetical protein
MRRSTTIQGGNSDWFLCPGTLLSGPLSILSENIGVPPEASEVALSESHPAEPTKTEATILESTQTLALPPNGSSPQKVGAN